jgi:16S rRNA (cytidine1402-2'-O)-methyltransferase
MDENRDIEMQNEGGLSSSWSSINESILPGALYVVATPIGNLADFTFRAAYILGKVDFIVAEDTRRTKTLLARYGIDAPLRSYHEHNARQVLPSLIKLLEAGSTLALVSDAGTPGISDPGYRLIKEAIDCGKSIIPITGASALLAAVVPSGLPLDRFVFEGFLPRKKGRQTRLQELAKEPRTIVIYESPNRVSKTLSDLKSKLEGDREVAICRELTKNYEEFIRGSLSELEEKYRETTLKGEIVIVVEGYGKRVRGEKKSGNKYQEFSMNIDPQESIDEEETQNNPPTFQFPDLTGK